MRQIAIYCGCLLLISARLPAACAQHVSVQEPSLETFGVGTTVSAPDRGGARLGGIGRGATSRSKYGLLPSGSNMGLSSQSGSVGVRVRIHDLDELDRRNLEAAGKAYQARNNVKMSASAEHAYETLRGRAAARDTPNHARGGVVADPTPTQTAKESANALPGLSAEKLLQRARDAEAAGKPQLALSYFRVARQFGSPDAAREIDRLSGKKR